MARRGDKLESQMFKHEIGAVQHSNFYLASVAGACIQMADGKAVAKSTESPLRKFLGKLPHLLLKFGRFLGDNAGFQNPEKNMMHVCSI